MKNTNSKSTKNPKKERKTTRAKNGHGMNRWRPERGKFEASIMIGGIRVPAYFDTEDEAERWLLEQRLKFTNSSDKATNTLVEDFLINWLVIKKPYVAKNTYISYERAFKIVYPFLHSKPITLFQAKPQYFKNLDNQLTNEGVTSHYRQEIKKILHAAFEEALTNGDIGLNPIRYSVNHTCQPPYVYSLEEYKRFIGYLFEFFPGFLIIFMFLGGKGPRRNECLGITWDRYDPETGVLIIDRQLIKKEGGGYELGPLKTKQSKRKIVLGKLLREAIKSHEKMQDQQKKLAGEKWHNDLNLMFTTSIGTPIDPDSLYKKLKRIIKKGGFSETTIHAFRHLNAEVMVEADINIKTAQELIGESPKSTTFLEIYARSSIKAKREAAEKVESLLMPDNILDILRDLQQNAADDTEVRI